MISNSVNTGKRKVLDVIRHIYLSYTGLTRKVWILGLVNFVNRSGNMVLAFATIYFTTKLQFSLKEAGTILAIYGVGSLIGNYAGGHLTEKFGSVRVQFISLILNGITLLFLMWMDSFWEVAILMFTLSVVSDIFRPANQVAITHYAPPETQTRSFSLIRLAFNLGWTVAPAIGGILIGLAGWHALFWVDAVTCFLAAGVLMWTLGLPGREHQKRNVDDAPPIGMQNVLKDTHFLLFCLFTVIGAYVFMQLLWTVPAYLKHDLHMSESAIGIIMAWNGVFVALTEMPLIYLIEPLRSKQWFIRAGLLAYAVSFLCIALPFDSIPLAWAFMTFISVGEILAMPFSMSWVFSYCRDKPRGKYLAMYSLSWALANILAPLTGTWLIEAWGYHMFWWFCTGLALVAMGGFLLFRFKEEN